jgi:hypothetical protein
VQLAGKVEDLLASHCLLTGPPAEAAKYSERPVVHVQRDEAEARLLVRAPPDDPVPPGWESHPVGPEELALAYLREPAPRRCSAQAAAEAPSRPCCRWCRALSGRSPGRRCWPGSWRPAQYLTQHGYTQWTRYQPGSRFWPFQWIESGWLLALSVLLIAATVWLVSRRAT